MMGYDRWLKSGCCRDAVRARFSNDAAPKVELGNDERVHIVSEIGDVPAPDGEQARGRSVIFRVIGC